ncbi:hypothetical protein [Maledivibacter halophilus]|uniref:Uncharacterized protein n=1 Tax=Maledivibacter halophilus TaxID=36842 RepID=A0A1T5KEG4_9FIRM|nr:hypothetical protein [Maledivibacter halophilus]SKC62057.1 hypothetical protein SAMN02194393_01734 [Maledivibacter halophilus]
MNCRQLSFFHKLEDFSMYDGYEVKDNVNIKIETGALIKLVKDQKAYLVTRHKDNTFSIDLPNEHGGAFGFVINCNQFKKHFRYLGRKIYPKRKEIWDGKSWIKNPDFSN